jgi:hypothetical protein
MARAGDGAVRSETRRRTEQVRVRVTPAERALIAQKARRLGHASAATFLRQMAIDDGTAPPSVARAVGLLGMAGGRLAQAGTALENAGLGEEAARLRDYTRSIANLQREMMEGADAGEGDPDAP